MSTEQAVSDTRQKTRFPVGPVILLTAICLTSGLALSFLDGILKDPIAAKKLEAFNAGLAVVLGENADQAQTVYVDENESKNNVYYALEAGHLLYAAEGSAKGYQSTIRVLVSVRVPKPADFKPDAPATFPPASTKLVMHHITVIESGETPGLGENVKLVEKDVSLWAKLGGAEEQAGKRPAFQTKFDGMTVPEPCGEDAVTGATMDSVDAISGATITSNAVKLAVCNAVKRIRKNTAR